MASINLFDGKKKPETKEPDNYKEKTVNLIYERTYTAGFVILGVLTGITLGIIPLPFIGLLPPFAAEALLVFLVASAFAFLPARYVHNRFKDYPVDYIFEASVSGDEEMIKAYQYYEGQFRKDFEVVEGSLTTWHNVLGKTTFMVNNIDPEAMEVEASYLGELNEVELMETKEKIDQQRLKNRKWSRVGMKLFARFEGIEDKVKTEYFQNLVRKGIEHQSYDPDKLLESVKEEIPEFGDDSDEESELEEMIDMINTREDSSVSLNAELGGSDDE